MAPPTLRSASTALPLTLGSPITPVAVPPLDPNASTPTAGRGRGLNRSVTFAGAVGSTPPSSGGVRSTPVTPNSAAGRTGPQGPAGPAFDPTPILAQLDALKKELAEQKKDSGVLRNANDVLQQELEDLRESKKTTSGEKEEDTRQFLPPAENSPYFPAPRNRESNKPYIAPLKGEATADDLSGEALAEYRTAHWVCSALFDVKHHLFDRDRRVLWTQAVEAAELSGSLPERDKHPAFFEAMLNHIDVAYELLTQRLELIRQRAHAKSKPGGATLTDKAMIDYVSNQLYGLNPDIASLDPVIRKHIESFHKKVVFSQLNAGAKAEIGKKTPEDPPKPSDKKARKERLKRQEAAAKKLSLPKD